MFIQLLYRNKNVFKIIIIQKITNKKVKKKKSSYRRSPGFVAAT